MCKVRQKNRTCLSVFRSCIELNFEVVISNLFLKVEGVLSRELNTLLTSSLECSEGNSMASELVASFESVRVDKSASVWCELRVFCKADSSYLSNKQLQTSLRVTYRGFFNGVGWNRDSKGEGE